MCVGGELSVKIFVCAGVVEGSLITSEINMCNYSALGRCLERAYPFLP